MKMPAIIGGLAILLGLLLVGVTVILALIKFLKTKNWTKTTGVVVDIIASKGMRRNQFGAGASRNTLYKPKVRFQTANGQVLDHEPKMATSWSNYSVGQPMPVYYDPRQPANAIIGTTGGLWYGLLVFGLVGVFFTFVGGIFLFIGLTSSF